MTATPPAESYQDRLNDQEVAANLLAYLVELLHPPSDEESPEVIRLRDIERRYPLTKLQANGPARQALAQSHRINRAQRQHKRLGLSEFYTGIIFLYYNADYHRALSHFTQARMYWGLVNNTTAICLTHYGQGLVHYYDGEYEAALRQFAIADRQMSRPHFLPNQEQFLQTMKQYMVKDKTAVLAKLWPPETEPEPEQVPASAPIDPVAQPQPPHSDMRPGQLTDPALPVEQQEKPDEPRSLRPALPPLDRMNVSTPIPSHLMPSQQYVWYQVVERYDHHFFPQLAPGDWLLVDTARPVDQTRQDTVIVQATDLQGGVAVEPYSRAQGIGQRIYLYHLGQLAGQRSFPFVVSSGECVLQIDSQQYIPTQTDDVIGVVIGKWQQHTLSA